MNVLTCPGCSTVGTLRTIVYGLPDPDTFNFEKYAVGGCTLNGHGNEPEVKCRICEWAGMREDM